MRNYLTAGFLALVAALGHPALAQVTLEDSSGNIVTIPGATPAGAKVTVPSITLPPKPPTPGDVTKAATLPADYKQCSAEWARCTYSGTQPVYYGSAGNYFVKAVTGTFDCRNETFGGDPSVNIPKFCYTHQPGTTTPPPVVTNPPVDPGTPPVSTGWSREEPFAAGSYWKAPIQASARYSDRNDPRVRSLMMTGAFYPNTTQWTQWVNYPGTNCKVVTVRVNSGFITGNYAQGNEVKPTICMPPNAKRDPARAGGQDASWGYNRQADNHAIFMDTDGKTAHEFWQFHNSAANGSGEWRAVSYARTALDGIGYNYSNLAGQKGAGTTLIGGWGATRAYGGSALGGLIRAGEVTRGINHKVSIALPAAIQYYNPANPAGSAVFPPATRPDTAGGLGVNQTIKHGQLFAIPKNIDVTKLGLTGAGLALAKALQTYGMVVVDQAGGATFNVDGFASADGAALNSAGADRARLWQLMVAVDNP